MSLSVYVHAMGRGPGRARHLTQDEARDAMAQMLSGDAAPEAVGALLMLMRYRGETPEEIAGFAEALRADGTAWTGPAPAFDWPTYAAGRSRGLPWFLLAAKLIAGSGRPVLLHGWNSHQSADASVRAVLGSIGISSCASVPEAEDALASEAIAYLPLEAISQDALRLLRLRDVLGLRSPINTALRLMNPGRAPTSVQGVFHPPYLGLQTDASRILGQPNQLVIKGAGGEFERNPAKDIALTGLADDRDVLSTAPALLPDHARLADATALTAPEDLAALWSGAKTDAVAEAIVTGTAALALCAQGTPLPAAEREAETLWATRSLALAA